MTRTHIKGWKARLIVVLTAFLPLVALEGILWIIGCQGDPHTTLVPGRKAFEVKQGMVHLAPERQGLFRTRPFSVT